MRTNGLDPLISAHVAPKRAKHMVNKPVDSF
jgi:hypothetical protein